MLEAFAPVSSPPIHHGTLGLMGGRKGGAGGKGHGALESGSPGSLCCRCYRVAELGFQLAPEPTILSHGYFPFLKVGRAALGLLSGLLDANKSLSPTEVSSQGGEVVVLLCTPSTPTPYFPFQKQETCNAVTCSLVFLSH